MLQIELLAILTVIQLTSSIRLQRITLYSDNCCKGRNETFTIRAKNMDEISDIVASDKMRSFSVHRGMWTLFRSPSYVPPSFTQEGNDDDSVGNCGSSATGSGSYTQYKSMRFVGNSKVDFPGISLYSDTTLQGDELYFDGKELILTRPFDFKSYGMTGKESWTAIAAGGNGTCLESKGRTVSYIDSFPANATTGVRVLRRGCGKLARQGRLQHQNLLKLFTKPEKSGAELSTDGSELRLPSPVSFESYIHIGPKNWTVYSGTQFDGDFDCLVSRKEVFVNEKLIVGSIRRGCKGDPVAEEPPTEVTDKQTAAGSGSCHISSFSYMVLGMVLLVTG